MNKYHHLPHNNSLNFVRVFFVTTVKLNTQCIATIVLSRSITGSQSNWNKKYCVRNKRYVAIQQSKCARISGRMINQIRDPRLNETRNIFRNVQEMWLFNRANPCVVPNHVNLEDKITSYLLTYSMVQSPSWEANWFAASQEIPSISRNPKVHYRTHKRPPPVSILGQPNPGQIPTSHLLEIRS